MQMLLLYWGFHFAIVRPLCTTFSIILINTYHADVALYIEGSTLLSEEGTTQGDPLVMPMYALVWWRCHCLQQSELRLWWDKLLQFGLDFGYFQSPSKTCLVVKESLYDAVVEMFRGSGNSITIAVDAKQDLGGGGTWVTSLCCPFSQGKGFCLDSRAGFTFGHFCYPSSCCIYSLHWWFYWQVELSDKVYSKYSDLFGSSWNYHTNLFITKFDRPIII